MNRLYHPLLALIASASQNELAKYVEYLKHENKVLRARLPKQVHTTYEERQTLVKYGKGLGRAIEELITIVTPTSFYRWVREAKNGKPKPKNPKGGQRKPKELRELVLAITVRAAHGDGDRTTRISDALRGALRIGQRLDHDVQDRQTRQNGVAVEPTLVMLGRTIAYRHARQFG